MPEPVQATKDSFRTELDRLVGNFVAHEAEYTSPGYPEAQARTDFITPFFCALGWDVENRGGKSYLVAISRAHVSGVEAAACLRCSQKGGSI